MVREPNNAASFGMPIFQRGYNDADGYDKNLLDKPIETAFREAIRRGLGWAIIHLHESGGGPRYREAVLWSCLNDLTYDRQCEGGREDYLADLITATGEPEFYRHWLLRATAPERLHGRGGEQLLALLRVYAERGDAEARARLYEIYESNVTSTRPDGGSELVELDGLAGLLTVAPKLDLDPDDIWFAHYLIAEASERDGGSATWAALEGLGEREPAVAQMIALVRADEAATRAQRDNDEASPWPTDYPTIRAQLLAGERRAQQTLWRWSREVTDAELVPAATDLLAETDSQRRYAYLRVFAKRRFPIDYAPLLIWARDPSPRLAALAITALSLIEADNVRALAFDLLATGSGRGARLLAANHRSGDFALLEQLLLTWTARDELHALGFGLRDLAEAHPAEEARGALLASYERGPCSLCRHYAVELLMALGPLPAWLAAECRWDTNPRIRELVAA